MLPEKENAVGIVTDYEQYTKEELVKDIFVGGDCFNVEEGSIQYSGSEQAMGYFAQGADAINIEEGIIMSSGRISNAEGANQVSGAGSLMGGSTDDPDLAILLDDPNYQLYDLVALEFDFTPTDELISFEYVFASEEYCEYVNSEFNDVFGFFISGPGINGPFTNGAENIAVVPGTSDYIAINSVNHLQNSTYYRDNVPFDHHSFMSPPCEEYPWADGVAIELMEYDGFTAVMTAMATVVPCETYHIKLALADLDDANFDSAVFLKANSFNAGGTAVVSTEVPGFPDNAITESCTDGFFVFERSNDELEDSLTVNFSISNQSTAWAGIDYEPLPNSITLLPGDAVYYLPVTVFEDALEEGTERIILRLDIPCSCDLPFTELLIHDSAPLVAPPVSKTICVDEALDLSSSITGGVPGYTYLWSTNETTPSIQVQPPTSTDYTLTVTDGCGNTIATTMAVTVKELPEALLTGYVEVCPENPVANLQVDFVGTGPWAIDYTIDNIPQTSIVGITDNPYLLPTLQAGTYHLTGVSSGPCQGSAIGAGTIVETNLQTSINVDPLTCPDINNGQIELNPSGGLEPYTYAWSNNATTSTLSDLAAGTYTTTITDAKGCTRTETVVVPLDAGIPEVTAGTDELLNCTITSVNLQATASMGMAYTYLWSTIDGALVDGTTTLTPLVNGGGQYILAVTNELTGCVRYDTVDVLVDTLAPEVQIAIDGVSVLTCLDSTTWLNASQSQPIADLTFEWSTLDGVLEVGTEDLPLQSINTPGTYDLLLTNELNGCTQNNSVTIVAQQADPIVNIAAAPPLTCAQPTIQLDASNSSSGSEFTFSWTTVDGHIVDGPTSPWPSVDAPGTYELTIINQQTGCTSSESMVLVQDTLAPTASIIPLAEKLDCDTPELSLSGAGSSVGAPFTYQWTSIDSGWIIDGANELNPRIGAAGSYQLVVTNQTNGCTNSQTITVEEDLTRPIIELLVQGSTELTCLETSTVLNAQNSTPTGLLIFKWSTADGWLNP
ncbi:MAG: choice-of-anchor L domain-containing protein, partial [Bacteroidota bacterium]